MILIKTLTTFLLAVPLYGQFTGDSTDIYVHLSRLWERLSTIRDSSSEAVDNRAITTDLLDLSSVFADYKYQVVQVDSSTIRLDAQLPPYLGILTTTLSFMLSSDRENNFSVRYLSPLAEKNGQIVYDDSTVVFVEGREQLPPGYQALVVKNLLLYRTLSLPALFRPHLPTDQSPVVCYFHGRDTDALQYNTFNHWLATLYALADGLMVYAVPATVTLDGKEVTIRFYLVLTTEEAFGNHFMIIDEYYLTVKGSPVKTQTVVHFYPFVRVDNLLALYSSPTQRAKEDRFRLQNKRK